MRTGLPYAVMGDLLPSFFAWAAQQELEMISLGILADSEKRRPRPAAIRRDRRRRYRTRRWRWWPVSGGTTWALADRHRSGSFADDGQSLPDQLEIPDEPMT